MRVLRTGAAIAAVSMAAVGTASGQSTATQDVTFTVQAINEISVSASTVSLTINDATPGSAPTAVTNTATSWAVTTNQTGAKITASLNLAMPTGVTLSALLAKPTGAGGPTSATALTTVAQDLVTGITKLNESALQITYELAATSAAGVINSDNTRTVTFTITGGT